jgi:ABC-2 type transport system permease protein
MVSYIWLGQAFLVLMPWSPDPEVRDCIRTGSIGTELLKPLDLYSLWFAKALGLKSAQLSLRALPILLFAGLLLPALGLDEWRLLPPASLAHFLAFLLSLAAAILLCAAVVCVYDVLLFRSVSAVGSTAMVASLVALGSGILVPLPVLPPRMAAALRLLPFSGLGDAPFRFWTGTAPLASLPASLAHQLLWLLALALLGRAVVRRELLRLEVLGG